MSKDFLSQDELALLAHVDNRLAGQADVPLPQVCDLLLSTTPKADPAFQRELKEQLLNTTRSVKPTILSGGKRLQRPAVFITLTALLIFGLTTPLGQTFAQQILDLFARSESNTLIIESTRKAPTPDYTITPTPFASINYFQSIYNLSIPQAEDLSGFSVRVPTNMPEEFKFIGAKFESATNKITLVYTLPNPGPVMDTTVFISQQTEYFEDIEWSLIGPDTEVKTVTIGDTSGYWVEGGWIMVAGSTQGGDDPGDTITQEFYWDKTFVPVHTLRWQQDGFYFQIVIQGSDTQEGYLFMDDAVEIAEGLQ